MDTTGPCREQCVRTEIEDYIDEDYLGLYGLYITENRCINCIKNIIEKMDLSYEAMNEEKFIIWFIAIQKERKDVLEALLVYGIEQYTDCVDALGRDSYYFLTHLVSTENFIEIFDLLVSAGVEIPGGCIVNYIAKQIGHNFFDLTKIRALSLMYLLKERGYIDVDFVYSPMYSGDISS